MGIQEGLLELLLRSDEAQQPVGMDQGVPPTPQQHGGLQGLIDMSADMRGVRSESGQDMPASSNSGYGMEMAEKFATPPDMSQFANPQGLLNKMPAIRQPEQMQQMQQMHQMHPYLKSLLGG